MSSVTKLTLSAVFAGAALAAGAGTASAQYSFYNYGYNPYGGGYSSNYSYVNPGGIGINPYGGVYVQPYTAYQTQYYANPFYGVGGVTSAYVAPSIYGPGGYQYRYWRR